MNAGPQVLVHDDAALLAQAAAARLVTRLVDVQAARGSASVVLTGGGVGTAILAEVAAIPARDAVDWRRVDLWWGDERFLPDGHPDRNETQARAALLDKIELDPARVHPMPAADGPDGDDPEAAARRYESWLATATHPGSTAATHPDDAVATPPDDAVATRPGDEEGGRSSDDEGGLPGDAVARADAGVAARLGGDAVVGSGDGGAVPAFDVLLLGVGPDAHVASLFPGMPALSEEERTAVAVRNAPKPPPTRISLTLPAIRAAREVWLVAAGEAKAQAVHNALSGADPLQAPAAGARGTERTLVLLDEAAASRSATWLPGRLPL